MCFFRSIPLPEPARPVPDAARIVFYRRHKGTHKLGFHTLVTPKVPRGQPTHFLRIVDAGWLRAKEAKLQTPKIDFFGYRPLNQLSLTKESAAGEEFSSTEYGILPVGQNFATADINPLTIIWWWLDDENRPKLSKKGYMWADAVTEYVASNMLHRITATEGDFSRIPRLTDTFREDAFSPRPQPIG